MNGCLHCLEDCILSSNKYKLLLLLSNCTTGLCLTICTYCKESGSLVAQSVTLGTTAVTVAPSPGPPVKYHKYGGQQQTNPLYQRVSYKKEIGGGGGVVLT